MITLGWKLGVEIELLAPPGRSRADLAEAVAHACGGSVRHTLHLDSEPSKVPGHPVFYNLTPAFEVHDAAGEVHLRCVDDLTLQADLDRMAAPRPGWWRIVADDARLLRIFARHLHADQPLPQALEALQSVCGAQLAAAAGGLWRLVDDSGAPLAIAAPLPGERERPCELITPPITQDHAVVLDRLLVHARRLGFTVPVEGATHLHFDASALCAAPVLANLVHTLHRWRVPLRRLVRTPTRFRRVGEWPAAVLEAVQAEDFHTLDWPSARARLRAVDPAKYCDFNLRNLAYARADRHTFEVRILAATLDTLTVMRAAALFEAILQHCRVSAPIVAAPALAWDAPALRDWLQTLPLDPQVRAHWLQQVDALAVCA